LSTFHEEGKSLKNIEVDEVKRKMCVSKIGAHSCKVQGKVFLHRKNKKYLQKCLNPDVDEFYEV
jgi:hypothetical protein